MGSQTIGIFCAYRERPNNDGKDPYELVGRTIGTFWTHRERPGKAHMHLWEGLLIFFILIGKDQVAVGKTKCQ